MVRIKKVLSLFVAAVMTCSMLMAVQIKASASGSAVELKVSHGVMEPAKLNSDTISDIITAKRAEQLLRYDTFNYSKNSCGNKNKKRNNKNR
ncbi:MAG: hypothetical protein Q8942_17760 [Bacillota bacterium]|nr:hypothetical protein [Bacillota bacterium]